MKLKHSDFSKKIDVFAFHFSSLHQEHGICYASIGFIVNMGTGIENSIDSKNWYEIDYKNKVGIVFGSEGKGIRRLIKDSCDFLGTIPMQGKTNSLNVSAAVSAVTIERLRQLLK